MDKFFIHIYEWFDRHPRIFYSVLFVSILVFALMGSRISFQEDITNFFNNSKQTKNSVFENFKAKDKIIVMVSGDDPDLMIESASVFEDNLSVAKSDSLISYITAGADMEIIGKCTSFVYDYLPVFLDDADFGRIEAKLSEDSIYKSVKAVYDQITSPSGMVVGDVLMRDPLGIGTGILRKFENFSPDFEYEIYNGYLFSKDMNTLLMFIEPVNGMGDTGRNDRLVTHLENAAKEASVNGVSIDYIGGPVVAVYNARQIRKDTTLTFGIALIFILVVITLSFRNRWAIPLILLPPAFGALFALAMVWLIQKEISVIAIGAGTVVLGISLSYSIHIISHSNHSSSPRKLIQELTIPLTLGCLTTIGAFAALIFTSSALLQDMGLFSVFTLIGTVLFCLVFLPHFIKTGSDYKKSRLLGIVERIVSYRYDGNKWVVIPVVVLAVIALFFYQKVEFDDNMSNINYMPRHIVEAEERSGRIFGDASREVYILTGHSSLDSLSVQYSVLRDLLDGYEDSGKVEEIVGIDDFVISSDEQQRRIDRWNMFWDRYRAETIRNVAEVSSELGFREGAFSGFFGLITKDYAPCSYSVDEIGDIPVISEWLDTSGDTKTVLCRIDIDNADKEAVYSAVDNLNSSVVIDRGYFSSKMVESTSNDFNYILLVSSLLVFIGLFISYGRIELTLLTFLPMCISWVIILGMMAVLDMKFNIVNIILATFIFGIGDDFSIFIMDGLLQEYRNGKKVLAAHKTAIFFSAFTAIVGMGVLIFAHHPALKSIALISVLGLSVVVFVSYTIQPVLFRFLITSQTSRGGFPYTLSSIANTFYCFVYFLLGCILSQIFMLFLMVLPLKRETKKLAFHKMIYWFTRLFLSTMFTVRTVRQNPYGETLSQPAVIIANHQSFIDILLLLSTTPRIVMVTNSWVWNSPFFGWIVKYSDFHHSVDGYESLAERLSERVREGYSIVVFPEGTRSPDCSIKRFHKGAFYLASRLKMDILPVIIYGAGQVSAKFQGFYIKHGIIVAKMMKRIKYGDFSFGQTYQEQSKNYRKWFIEQYRIVNDEFGRTYNSYFRDAVIKNYTYKGPVLEWYMRIKCRIDGYYDFWDRMIPRDASVIDVGCGYGQMSFMLGLLSPERSILGIDYDSSKIGLARHSFLMQKTSCRFECADMRTVCFPAADAILFNDSLHYVDSKTQKAILARAAGSLNRNGMIIVRDGDFSLSGSHSRIEKTEVWSTRIIKFNKTSGPLDFVSSGWMKDFAASCGLDIKIRRCDRNSSETFYILKRKSDEQV